MMIVALVKNATIGTDITTRSTLVAAIRRAHLEKPARLVLRGFRAARVAERAATNRARGAYRAASDSLSRSRLFLRYRALLRGGIVFEEILGSPRDDALAIVVCLWNRPGRLEDVLRIVDSQQAERPLRLILWNNQQADEERYRSAISAFAPSNSVSSVEIFTSPTNIGGMGRFVAMRELVRRGYAGPFIMMDDDQDFSPSFVSDLLAEWEPRSIAGVWAWNTHGAYWKRTQVEESGAPARHVGTGGCVCDSVMVADDAFFRRIPMRFLFMEDIWMSHCAARNGWSLRMAASPVTFVLAELDQGHAIFDRKEHFFTWLKGPNRVPLLAGASVSLAGKV